MKHAAFLRLRRGAALTCAAALVGCSTSSKLAEPDPYDIAAGVYLTPKQYEDLSKDDALEYCQALAQEIDIQSDNRSLTEEELASTEKALAVIRGRLESAQGAIAALGEDLAGTGGAPAESTAPPIDAGTSPSTYRVAEGDWLFKIARRADIYGDAKGWQRLFEANRDRIQDPDLIYPGQVLVIPK